MLQSGKQENRRPKFSTVIPPNGRIRSQRSMCSDLLTAAVRELPELRGEQSEGSDQSGV